MKQPKFNYPISVSQAAAETGIDYRTIKKATRGLPSIPGPKASILYDGHELFPAIFLGPDGKGTASEALRKLSLARTAQIELDMEIKRGERIPLADVAATEKMVFGFIRGTLLANHNKVLTQAVIKSVCSRVAPLCFARNPKHDRSRLTEIAPVLVRLDHIASSFITGL